MGLLLYIVFVFVLFMAQIGVHHSVINIFYIVSALGDYSSSSLSCMVVFLIFQYLTFLGGNLVFDQTNLELQAQKILITKGGKLQVSSDTIYRCLSSNAMKNTFPFFLNS